MLLLLFLPGIDLAQQNIVLIIADDTGPDYYSCFNTSGGTASTPNINNLAAQGVKFTRAWASPLCSPTRAGLLTGRYPFRTGVGAVITGTASPQLDTLEPSFSRLLRDMAPTKYNTACVGKWHLNANVPQRRQYPNKLGFNFYAGNFNGALTNYFSYPLVVNGATATSNVYATTQTINDAIDWIDSIGTNKPFFLWIAFNAPHTPYHVPPASLCSTVGLLGTTADINANPEKYFKAALEALDTEVGRLLQHLTTKNLRDSTNIIFIGDNGNSQEVAKTTYTNHAKGTIYDYGVSVPVIVSGPAVVAPNRSSNALINTPDLFATILEMGRFTNWRNALSQSTQLDARSFLPVIKNQTVTPRTWMFTEQFNSPANASDGKTIRNTKYHLLRFDNGTEALYDLEADPSEGSNLLSGAMSQEAIANYQQLCDTLFSLTGNGKCVYAGTRQTMPNVLAVYPNPASTALYISTPLPMVDWRVSDALGREVCNGAGPCNLAIGDWPAGLYILKTATGEAIKFIKH